MSASQNKESSAAATKATETKAGEPRDPEQIREEIDETREQLGETVAVVAEKTDVKKQAQARKEELKEQASAKADEAKEKAKEIGNRAKDAAPDSAQEGVAQVQRVASENPVPMALAGAFLAGIVAGRLLSR
jgi:ElaB/YqjD/DUF883 family membrane-anchored ribosome-binding protein